MIELDWDRCATAVRPHQKVGTRWLVTDSDPARGRVVPNVYLLADEVSVGKSKQQVDATQFLWNDGAIDSVVVCSPAQGRGVWADPRPALGEVAKHGHSTVPNEVVEYSVRHGRVKPFNPKALTWMVTNYEFIRRGERLEPLLKALQGKRFWLVCDEAWALADVSTAQWKAVHKIRQLASRVTLLNGTPVVDTPLDVYGQAFMMHSRILNIRSARTGGPVFSHFRARYAMLKPNVSFPLITGWQNLEELRAKMEPYILRRLVSEVYPDVVELDPILVEAKLSDETWRIYRQMRDEMVAWLSTEEASVTQQAMVRGLRLAQITSGFLGGIQRMDEEGFLDFGGPVLGVPPGSVKEIGREKLDAALAFLKEQRPQPGRVLVWSRFRPEIERMAKEFHPLHCDPHLSRRAHLLYGGAKKQGALDALNPDLNPGEPVIVVGSRGAGGAAVNLAGADLELNLSYTFLLREFLQARGRTSGGRRLGRPPIRRVDFVATGPKGQRTIDHVVLAELREKKSIADWTAATWRQKLLEE